jgi:hypothetical protein
MRKMIVKNILQCIIMISIFMLVFSFIPHSDAHILVIGDSHSDLPNALKETQSVSQLLKLKGYKVVELYGSKATAANILKGMYNADAIIYAGHGGYKAGNYNSKGGTATSPFAIMGSDDYIWGVGTKMREGWDYTRIFNAPIKYKIPVFFVYTCFSTGYVGNKEVANPIQTIYNFSRMFTGAGANYYASCYDASAVREFLKGATNFKEINERSWEKITRHTTYNGVPIWRNSAPYGHVAFVGDWYGKFPTASKVTAYDSAAATTWYNSNRQSVVDLIPTSILAPTKGVIGKTFYTSNSVKNRGVASINKPFYVSYWLTKQKTSLGMIYLGKRTILSVSAGTTNNHKTALKIPTTTKPGKYYLRTMVDTNNNIAEFAENNNVRYSSTTINVVRS